jgi:glycerol transport system ATP-binding protein
MTIWPSLCGTVAFPKTEIKARVSEIAEMLELTRTLDNRASGLTADGKQKISLGRGLVRSDVNVIMFDEPLTVIDPHLKWQLRSKLKELHLRTRRTMIYVTHDQTEALTFRGPGGGDEPGRGGAGGTPIDLFEKPQHTFVGHFIGSPGMNVLPCDVKGGVAVFAGEAIAVGNGAQVTGKGRTELGVRPEFVSIAKTGIPAEVVRVADAGRFRILETRSLGHSIKLLVKEGETVPEGSTFLAFDPDHTQVYEDGWMAGARR